MKYMLGMCVEDCCYLNQLNHLDHFHITCLFLLCTLNTRLDGLFK